MPDGWLADPAEQQQAAVAKQCPTVEDALEK
jgi:hypothetical protein